MAGKLKAEENDYNWRFRYRYETLRAILNRNGRVLEILSDLEADYNHLAFSDFQVRRSVRRLFDETCLMAQELNILSHGRHSALFGALDRIRREVNGKEQEVSERQQRPLSVPLNDEESLDPGLVGGKAAGLSSLYHNFPGRVPEGFVLTTGAYEQFLRKGKLFEQIRLLLKDLEYTSDRDRFRQRSGSIREAIVSAELPASLHEEIRRQAAACGAAETSLWAVRSSAVGEDGRFSFAGQFDSVLNVSPEDLPRAYREVIAGKFSERAITYRIHCGFREVDTPMAVLFMPMVDARAAGVAYTVDPVDPESDTMAIHCVNGLGQAVVKGIGVPDSIALSRQARPEIRRMQASGIPVEKLEYLSREEIREVGATAWKAAVAFGHDLDIEWAVDKNGHVRLLQARRVQPAGSVKTGEVKPGKGTWLIGKGTTIFPGRAEGPVAVRSAENPDPIPKGAVLVVRQPTPDLAPLLSEAAAVIAAEGSPVGHLATLLREFAVPSIFQAGGQIADLREGHVISVDASRRRVYPGSLWPGMKERVLARLASAGKRKEEGPLFRNILALNLVDPFGPGFKPGRCRSVHDAIRFIHEMAVRSMFRFGDEHSRFLNRKTKRLKSEIPMPIHVLSLEQELPAEEKALAPEFLSSTPFEAFWKGFSDRRLAWPDRWGGVHAAISSDLQDQVFGGAKGPRRRKDPNYLIYARDYMNFNARFAYHYAMVDSLLGPGERNNYIQLRFHSGGGSDERRKRRAGFLERVLRESRFGVTREGDLITAWFRNYPSQDTRLALTLLGRLLVCSRQLDMLMHMDSDVTMFADHFLAGKFQSFS
ncbi:MAG: pyruvate, water dikinase [Acidobacteria bacterium]|nr:pyruvate, water dikinase [Acidobacteriota bacterium]